MNLLYRYSEFKKAKTFNSADIKGVLNVNGYSFDIRIVNEEIYANGLPLKDFFEEAMVSLEEEILYEEAIYQWLCDLSKSRVA